MELNGEVSNFKNKNLFNTLTFAIAAACWLRSWPLLPEVVVGGPWIGTLLEAAEGEDVEVAEADTEDGGSNDARVVGNGNDDVDDAAPLWAYSKILRISSERPKWLFF